jgi:hypothetical protein
MDLEFVGSCMTLLVYSLFKKPNFRFFGVLLSILEPKFVL